MGVKGRTFNDSSEYYSERIRMLEKELEESNEKNKNYMAANEKLKEDYRISRNEIDLLNIGNKELREQVKFHKQKYDMAIATPTPTAAFEEEIKQLKDKVVLWKKDAEKSKEEAQKFREQCIKEAGMKEKYSNGFDIMQASYKVEKEARKKAETEKEKYRNEFNVMEAFYEVEKERAKKAEAESQKLLEELKKEKENSEYFSEKSMIAIETIKHADKEIARLKEEVQKWKDTYSEEAQRPVEHASAVLSESRMITGEPEVIEDFKLPEVFAVMRCNSEDPELFSNPVEAIERTEALNKEKDAYNIRTVRILKVK